MTRSLFWLSRSVVVAYVLLARLGDGRKAVGSVNNNCTYWRIVPKPGKGPDVYRRRYASRAEAEEVLHSLERVGYEAAEYTPNGKRCVRTKPDGTTIE